MTNRHGLRPIVGLSALLAVFVARASALAGSGTIQGSIYCDADHGGTITPGDVPVDGVTVRVTVNGGPGQETTTPDAATPGHYLIVVTWAGISFGSTDIELVAGLPQGVTPPSRNISIADGVSTTQDFLLDCVCGAPTSSSTTTTIGGTTTTLQQASIDTLSCYKVADLKNPAFADREGLVLADELGTRPVDVKKPDMLCMPATQDGAGMGDPAAHVCCYKVKGPKLPAPVAAQVSDRYGGLQLKIKRSALLCQPCGQALLP